MLSLGSGVGRADNMGKTNCTDSASLDLLTEKAKRTKHQSGGAKSARGNIKTVSFEPVDRLAAQVTRQDVGDIGVLADLDGQKAIVVVDATALAEPGRRSVPTSR